MVGDTTACPSSTTLRCRGAPAAGAALACAGVCEDGEAVSCMLCALSTQHTGSALGGPDPCHRPARWGGRVLEYQKGDDGLQILLYPFSFAGACFPLLMVYRGWQRQGPPLLLAPSPSRPRPPYPYPTSATADSCSASVSTISCGNHLWHIWMKS